MKKTAAIFILSVLLLILSACGKIRADIPVTKLEFGMSEREVGPWLNVGPYEGDKYADPAFPVYVGTTDIDDGLQDCMFVFSEDRLYEIYLYSDEMPQEDCFALKDRLIQKLSGLYGASEVDWETENNGYQNFYKYENDNGQTVWLYIRLYDTDDNGNAFMILIFRSDEHSFSTLDDGENIDSVENIPVIPKK